jgi:hypothetical protein
LIEFFAQKAMIDPAEGTANGTSAIGSGWLGRDFGISSLRRRLAGDETSRAAKYGVGVNTEFSSDRADFPVFGIKAVRNLSLIR